MPSDQMTGSEEVLPDPDDEPRVRRWWGHLNEDRALQTRVGLLLTLLDVIAAALHAPAPVIIVIAIPGAWILRSAVTNSRIL